MLLTSVAGRCSDQFRINIRPTSSDDVSGTGESSNSRPETEKPGFVGSRVPVRACSFWWSQRNSCSLSVVASECRLKHFWGSSEWYSLSAITYTRAELQVLLVTLTRSDSAAVHQKWWESCLSMNQMTFSWFLLSSLDSCSQILDCSGYFASPVWFCLQELTLLANVRLWQARSLVTTIVPWGPLALSLPLKCVHYTVVDNIQKDG